MRKAVISLIALLPIGLLFLWLNDDRWMKPGMSWGLVVYIMVLGFSCCFWELALSVSALLSFTTRLGF